MYRNEVVRQEGRMNIRTVSVSIRMGPCQDAHALFRQAVAVPLTHPGTVLYEDISLGGKGDERV
jgi:hypothetical protein